MDNTFLNVFLLTAAACVILLTALLAVALFYLITFLYAVKRIVRSAHRASEIISEDVMELRNNFKEEGLNLKAIARFANNIRKRRSSRKNH